MGNHSFVIDFSTGAHTLHIIVHLVMCYEHNAERSRF